MAVGYDIDIRSHCNSQSRKRISAVGLMRKRSSTCGGILPSIAFAAIMGIVTGCLRTPPAAPVPLQVEAGHWRRNEPAEVRVHTYPPRAVQVVSLQFLAPAAASPEPLIDRGADLFGLAGVQLLWLTPEQQETEIALAASAGAQAISLDFEWRNIEPEPGQFTWEATDRAVALASRYGLRLVPILMYTPRWASSAAYAPLDYHLAPPVNLRDYRDFVYAVVNRYKPPQASEFGIRDWIIWNEPNVSASPHIPRPGNFWTGSLGEYIQLLRAGYEGAHAADPNSNILNGGLADVFWAEGEADLITSLERLYDPNGDGDAGDGGRPFFDTLNIHIYPTGVPDSGWYTTRLEAVTSVMKRFGDGDKLIWITETGFGSVANPALDSPYLSEGAQADGVRLVYETMAAYPLVERVFWWSLREYYHDASSTNEEMEAHFGLLRASFAPKPAYLAYARLTGHLDQAVTLSATTDSEGTARMIIPAELFAQPGYYVLFVSAEQLPGTAVVVQSVDP